MKLKTSHNNFFQSHCFLSYVLGSLRNAYFVRNLAQPEITYVAKICKNSKHGREVYENDVEMQIYCQRWAQKYNEMNPPKKVKYADAWLLGKNHYS